MPFFYWKEEMVNVARVEGGQSVIDTITTNEALEGGEESKCEEEEE